MVGSWERSLLRLHLSQKVPSHYGVEFELGQFQVLCLVGILFNQDWLCSMCLLLKIYLDVLERWSFGGRALVLVLVLVLDRF